jgi:hypothetical protein
MFLLLIQLQQQHQQVSSFFEYLTRFFLKIPINSNLIQLQQQWQRQQRAQVQFVLTWINLNILTIFKNISLIYIQRHLLYQ